MDLVLVLDASTSVSDPNFELMKHFAADLVSVADIDGEPAGACAVKEGEIDLMMVALKYHRSGIGSALLEDGERRLFRDHNRIVLESFRDNLQANTFYEKHGWSIESRFTMPDFAIPMVRMTKQR